MGAASRWLKGALLSLLEAADGLRPGRDLLPIINYHAIDEDESPTSLSPRRFAAHLDELAARGMRTVTFRETLDLLARDGPLPPRTVCLTFDDGLASVRDAAFPRLRERGFRATVFLTTGAAEHRVSWERDPSIVARRLLAPEQVRELAAAGFEIGGHTRTHPHLTELDGDELDAEIAGNRDDVASITGTAPATFAYPYGDHDDRVVAALKRAGYQGACTVRPPGRRMGRDLFRVERFDASRFSRMDDGLGLKAFRSCLSGVFSDYVRMKSALPVLRARTFEYQERKRRHASGR